jgi:hypothetical protein
MKDNDVRVPSSIYSTNDTRPTSRIASSLYSQPSPTFPDRIQTTALPQHEQERDEISPVSTPRSATHLDSSTVSPIESSFNISSPKRNSSGQGFKSHIPRPVSAIKSESTTTPEQRIKKEDTRWDEYSGEPTADETGKRGSVQLGSQQPVQMQFPQLKERTKQILAGLRDRDAATKTPVWGKQPPPVDDLDAPAQQRPPWKGASGREATVDPVRNTPAARKGPIHLPQRNVSRSNPVADRARTQSPEVAAQGRFSPSAQPVQEPEQSRQESLTPENTIRAIPSQESVKPVAPLKAKKVRAQTDPMTSSSLHSPFQSPVQQHNYSTQRSRTHETNPTSLGRASPDDLEVQVVPDEPATPVQPSIRAPNNNLAPSQTEDTSRFSWTTYATTVNDSPPGMHPTIDSSPVPPMPALPNPTSIKKRPVSSSQAPLPFANPEARYSNASLLTRKPIGDRNRSSSVATMQSSKAKDLPPTPQESLAGDKIAALEARQSDLLTRKRNNSKIRVELQESLKRNAITYDVYKRKQVEARIKELEQDLQEMQQEEHDVGVQLHRSQKKRDRENEYGPSTSLWIKNVTN